MIFGVMNVHFVSCTCKKAPIYITDKTFQTISINFDFMMNTFLIFKEMHNVSIWMTEPQVEHQFHKLN